MTETSTTAVRVSRRFGASAERVFDAWLDPDIASRFLFATPSGEMVRADIDARVGGRYSLVERRDGEDVEHTGEYLEIVRPSRLVFTFGVPKYGDATTIVTIEIASLGEGCELTLTDQTVPTEWAERNREGWTAILDGLGGVTDAA